MAITVEEALLVCMINKHTNFSSNKIPVNLLNTTKIGETASIAGALNVEENYNGNWCFDSVATSHMCHDDTFTELKLVVN